MCLNSLFTVGQRISVLQQILSLLPRSQEWSMKFWNWNGPKEFVGTLLSAVPTIQLLAIVIDRRAIQFDNSNYHYALCC